MNELRFMDGDGNNISVSREKIGPGRAGEYLEKNANNRSKKMKSISLFAQEMLTGLWRFNGQTISFDSDGFLANGQNRLHAIVRSGTEQEFLVVRGIGSEAKDTNDIGVVRTLADKLKMDGCANYTTVAAIAGLQYTYEMSNGSMSPAYGSLIEKHQCLERNVGILDAAKFSRNKEFRNFGSSTRVAWFRYITRQKNPSRSDEFFDRLLLRSSFAQTSTCPASALRTYLIKLKVMAGQQTAGRVVIAHCIKCWNAFVDDKQVHSLRFSLINEKFPVLK